jgi:fibronectin-binding autotransporter adhesin
VEGSGVGSTLTWYGDNGFYVDGQAQTMFCRSDLSSSLVGSLTDGNDYFGYAFSAQAGQRFAVDNDWSLTPQAQLAYSKVDFDKFTDPFGAQVSLHHADSLIGRAGLSLNHQKTWNDAGQIVRSDVYGIANLDYEFLNGSNVDVSGTSLASANDRLWGSIGGGSTYSWANGRYAIFGEVSYNASLNDSERAIPPFVSIFDYARNAAAIYWDANLVDRQNPEECAENDMSFWPADFPVKRLGG